MLYKNRGKKRFHAMSLIIRLTIFLDDLRAKTRGQDLIEYALLSGFVATTAAAVMPDIAALVYTTLRRARTVLRCAGGRTRSCDVIASWGDDE